MKYGIYIANHGISSNPGDYIDLAIIAEKNGWNGFFIWDHVHIHSNDTHPVLDPWITLAAIASHTEDVKIGTTITPLARRRPWIIAKEAVTLDRLSRGRFILGVGLGVSSEFEFFGEETDSRIRREKLDEALEIITGLWTGESFTHLGKHFTIKDVKFEPKPIRGHIPIWIGGTWPNKRPFRRAARYDGVFPLKVGFEEPLSPDEMKDIIEYIKSQRSSSKPFDVVRTIVSTGNKEEDSWIHNFIGIGVTWLVEAIWPGRDSLKNLKKVIERGPPISY